MHWQLKTHLLGTIAPWIGGTLALLIVGLALFLATEPASGQVSEAPRAASTDITFGSEGAQVVLVEYSDFQCEFCAQYASVLETLRETYRDQVRFVFRFFPLENHRYSMIVARAAYGALLQDRFWEMHDLIYQRQQEWSESEDPSPYFDTYATQLGLDIDRFHSDMAAETTTRFIMEQERTGESAGVDHTPWFILNDSVVVPGAPDDLESFIQGAL